MAELQPPETVQINGNGASISTATTITTTVSAGAIFSGTGGTSSVAGLTSSDTVLGTTTTKRQRRPSVRLGDLGGDSHHLHHNQTFDSHHPRRASKPSWRTHGATADNRIAAAAKSASKTRPVVNFSETLETEEREREGNLEAMAIGGWRIGKESSPSVRKRGGLASTKRVRSNWISSSSSKLEEDADENENINDGGGGENSDSQAANSMEEEEEEEVEEDEEERYNNNDNNNNNNNVYGRDWNGHGIGEEDGVRVWLNGLGLGRYAPVFEIHEVDDEILPMLTLEDLKDMGINAVGSRRKMFCAIQKLGKGFS